jgi:signal transduction histidine kinase/CheY-like chemotaxis protein
MRVEWKFLLFHRFKTDYPPENLANLRLMVPWFNKLINAGTKSEAGEFTNERIRNLNISLFAGTAFVLLNTAYVSYLGLAYTTLLDLSYCLALVIAYFLNRSGHHTLSISFAVVATNLFFLGGSYIEGRFAGNYLLFIPLTVVLALLVRLKQNVYQLVFFGVLMVVCLYLSFTICPAKSELQPVDDKQYFGMYITNICTAIAISAVFSYVLYKINVGNERKLIDEKEYINLLFNSSVEGVFLVDMKTRTVQDCNQRAMNLFELKDKSAFIGRSLKDIRPGFVKQVFENGVEVDPIKTVETDGWHGEIIYRTAKGGEFTADVSMVSFLNEGKDFLKVSITDISRLKKIEQDLRKAIEKAEESSLAKSKFLSNMSHELRTPLNGIIGTTNLMQDEKVSPEVKQHLDVLKFSSEHMLNLVNDVLDYSKLEDRKIIAEQNSFNLKKTIESGAAVFASQFAAKQLKFNVNETLNTTVVSDSTRLMQVVNNLLSNALKFTKNGRVDLSIKAVEVKSDEVVVNFSVADTGIGIPADMHQQIFERFTQADANTTRKFGGTGLGLTICKMLVELLGGKLNLESEIDKGSRFFFTLHLPRKESPVENTMSIVPSSFSLDGKKILLAEDNIVNMLVGKRFIQKWGATVTEAANGVIAVEEFRKQKFDLVLLDLEMPEMDGYQALQEVRKIDQHIPAIAFTAAVYENMLQDLTSKGFTDFIQKPFRPEQLQSVISKYIN